MTKNSASQDLIESAVDAIGHAVRHIFVQQPEVPFTSSTDLLGLTPNEEELVRRAEQASYRARPTVSAIHFCLTAASSLLAISHSLLDQSRPLSASERERRWRQFAEDTKVAGRCAYRAALVLSDSSAAMTDDPVHLKPAATPENVQWQIAQREKVLEKSKLYRQWNRIKADGITASEFIEFLRPLADLDGICVSYVYATEGGGERIYNHGRESPTENPLVDAIKKKGLTKEKALSFALNEEGRMWIERNFIEI